MNFEVTVTDDSSRRRLLDYTWYISFDIRKSSDESGEDYAEEIYTDLMQDSFSTTLVNNGVSLTGTIESYFVTRYPTPIPTSDPTREYLDVVSATASTAIVAVFVVLLLLFFVVMGVRKYRNPKSPDGDLQVKISSCLSSFTDAHGLHYDHTPLDFMDPRSDLFRLIKPRIAEPKLTWSLMLDLNKWEGIDADKVGRLISLDLSGMTIEDKIELYEISPCITPSLIRLDLSGIPALEGDIRVFKSARNLKYVCLHGSNVSGNVENFGTNKSLEVCDLHGSNVNGDLTVFSTLWQLMELDLTSTDVSGDLNALLEYLYSAWWKRSGEDTMDPQKAELFFPLTEEYKPSLQVELLDDQERPSLLVKVLDDQEKSDVKIPGTAPQVRKLHIRDAKEVTGEMSSNSIAVITAMKVHHGRDAVNLNSLGRITLTEELTEDVLNMRVIDICHVSSMEGRLEILVACSNLIILDVSESQLSGDLSIFREPQGEKRFLLPQLAELNLSETKVEGDMRVFGDLPQLTTLNLTACPRVHGTLIFLQTDINLKKLSLGRTRITGNVKVLKPLINLEEIHLTGLNVIGNVEVFEDFPFLKIIDLMDCDKIKGNHLFVVSNGFMRGNEQFDDGSVVH